MAPEESARAVSLRLRPKQPAERHFLKILLHVCCTLAEPDRPANSQGMPKGPLTCPFRSGRYWDRTSDLCRVKANWGGFLACKNRRKGLLTCGKICS